MREMSVAEQRYLAVLAVIADGHDVTAAAQRPTGCRGWKIARIGRGRVRIRCRRWWRRWYSSSGG
jgi:hypothetical protein